MPSFTARAEYNRLTHVRAHRPGLELWPGALDPETNLFDAPLPPERAAREHERMTDALETAGVKVHLLADDLAAAGELDDLVAEYVDVPEGVDESQRLSSANQSAKRSGDVDATAATAAFSPQETLELVLSRARLTEANDRTSVELRQPISNTLFQSDTVLVGDEGPVLCEMGEPVRQDELPVVRRAWEGFGAEFVHEMDNPLEGGEFLPADEFALLGVSAEIDGEEEVIRTTYEAGREFLDAGAVGFEEVGLVRAPLAADRRHREEHGIGSRVLHLLGWCNFAAEDLAVTDPTLAEHATVDVFRKTDDGYAFDRSMSTLAYLEKRGFDIVEMGPEERWAANFLTVDDGVVVPMHRTDADGAYDPDLNGTIERLKERGVEILPDGEGIPEGVLTRGAGGINCMTVPLERR